VSGQLRTMANCSFTSMKIELLYQLLWSRKFATSSNIKHDCAVKKSAMAQAHYHARFNIFLRLTFVCIVWPSHKLSHKDRLFDGLLKTALYLASTA